VDLQAWLAERTPAVDRALEARLPGGETEPRVLHAAMRHLLFPGGKRFRPALAMASAEAVGASAEQALPAAVAVELIHTYSLVHDDLPCMDDDDERRGRPTVHRAFGEAVAVLAGDALLAAAFETLASALDPAHPERCVLALRELARAAGSLALVGGQVDDLGFGDSAPEAGAALLRRIESIHERKTAALIEAAVHCGARLAGAGEPEIERLSAFGREVGLAFQIADDLLDECEDDSCTLLRALGPDAAKARADALLESALARIEGLGERAERLRDLATFAVRRKQ